MTPLAAKIHAHLAEHFGSIFEADELQLYVCAGESLAAIDAALAELHESDLVMLTDLGWRWHAPAPVKSSRGQRELF